MTSWKNTVNNDLSNLAASLGKKKSNIEKNIEELESGKTGRDEDRKNIMLNEIRNMLRSLSEADKKVIRDLKVEAFDSLRKINKLKEEILIQSKLVEAIVEQEEEASKEEIMKQLDSLKSCISMLKEVPKLEVAKSMYMADFTLQLTQGW